MTHAATEETGAVVRVRWARADLAEAVAVATALLPAESDRVARAAPVDRPAVALSLLLVRTLAAEVCGLPADAVRVDRRCPRCGATTHGVPRVRRVDGRPVPHVSLGRCADRVVVAASAAGPVGVDVERADAEAAALAALGADAGVGTGTHAASAGTSAADAGAGGARGPALRTWARTEALLKAAGTGLAIDPRGARVQEALRRQVVATDQRVAATDMLAEAGRSADTDRPARTDDLPDPPAGTRWWVDDLDLGGSHVGALALALPIGSAPRIELLEITPAHLTA